MKIILFLIRAVGVLGALAIAYWLAVDRPGWPPDITVPGALDNFLYFAVLPFSALAILLIVPYSLLPHPARQLCRLLLLLLAAYYLFYRYAPHFLPSPYPYSKPEPLTLAAGTSLIFWIAFFLAQLFALYNLDSHMPQPPPLKGGAKPKPLS